MHGIEASRNRLKLALAVLLLALSIAPWLFRVGTGAEASHSESPYRLHNYLMHYATTGHGANDEDYCVESNSAYMTDATFLNIVRNTLTTDGTHWDGLASWKVDLYNTGTYCLSLADDSWVEFEVYVETVNTTCGDNLSCVRHITPHASGKHYWYENVYFDYHNIDGGSDEHHTTVNHEFGHVFGLRDPSYTGDCQNGTSVMHQFNYYGCGQYDIDYPTSQDISAAGSLADNYGHP